MFSGRGYMTCDHEEVKRNIRPRVKSMYVLTNINCGYSLRQKQHRMFQPYFLSQIPFAIYKFNFKYMPQTYHI